MLRWVQDQKDYYYEYTEAKFGQLRNRAPATNIQWRAVDTCYKTLAFLHYRTSQNVLVSNNVYLRDRRDLMWSAKLIYCSA